MRDPGAARERTWLAWQRTAIVIAANGILLLRSPQVWIGVSAIVVLCAAPFIALSTATSVREHVDPVWVRARGDRNMRLLLAIAVGIGIIDLIAIAVG